MAKADIGNWTQEQIEAQRAEMLTPPGAPFSFRRVYKFEPHPTITAYELAQVWKVFQMQIGDDVFEKLPEHLKRHFTARC
jgi:hypothetical protein